jgi:photosystem II stability/assembly factor-like uncharacterized protein
MAQIRWITPAGDLGTYPESTEVSIGLEAGNPLGTTVGAGFDPRTSLTGNGTDSGRIDVFMPTTQDRWNIRSRNLPGRVRTGRFPNPQNPNTITAQFINVDWPYRGGLNRSNPVFQPTNGPIGISAVGIAFFGPSGDRYVPGTVPGRTWTLNAVETDIFGQDIFGGSTADGGVYHYRTSSFVVNDAWRDLDEWENGYVHPDGHSKIIGWAADGYPIYGSHGYRNALDANSKSIRMVSGYTVGRLRADRPQDATVTATATAVLRDRIQIRELGSVFIGMCVDVVGREDWQPGSIRVTQVLSTGEIVLNGLVSVRARDTLRAYFPLGSFLEDWSYTGPLGSTLDKHNGRYCVTPDFPGGTYAYFVTVDESDKPVYPYIIGNEFYGSPIIDGFRAVANLVPADQAALTYTMLSGTLPPGLQLQPAGVIYGYPTVLGPGDPVARQYEFAIRATNSAGQVADRGFSISVNGIRPPSLFPQTESLGIYFDSDYVNIELQSIQSNRATTTQWEISKGTLPPGLTLSSTGRIIGFALAPAQGGAAGSSAYDVGRYDQFVYDFEGSTLSRNYKFTVRVFDGINYTEQNYAIIVYARSFFRTDNILIKVDTDQFTADLDGYQYPSILTPSAQLPAARQQQNYAFQFKSYYANPNTPVFWKINASGPALYDQGAAPSPDTNGNFYDLVPYDNRSFDQTNLSLPSGLSIDEETGWITGTLGTTTSYEQYFDFEVVAYVRIAVSASSFSIRESQPVRYRLRILQNVADLVTWITPANLEDLENGALSNLKISARTTTGQPLTYRIKSGQYLRVPQGLKLLSSGAISGRTTFDFFSLDRYGQEIFFDQRTQTYDSRFTFTIIAENADATVYSEKEFTVVVKNVNQRPYENLYLRALLPLGLRNIFRSLVNDQRLLTSEIVYRPEDPYFGVPNDLRMLSVAGLRAETAENYMASMVDYHYHKTVNFGTIRKAVARVGGVGDVVYEVLYVDVLDYNDNNQPGDTIPTKTVVNTSILQVSDLGTLDSAVSSSADYQLISNRAVSTDDYGTIVDNIIESPVEIFSNSFANMNRELEQGIGYENKGALPLWMLSVQPTTGRAPGFVRALVLAYANPGQGDKLLYRYRSSLLSSGFGVTDIMNTFRFTADRYQWDRTLSVNYNAAEEQFEVSRQTTFDRIPSIGVVDQGTWITRTSDRTVDLRGVAYYPGKGYIAVGVGATILNSTGGEIWRSDSEFIDLSYNLAPIVQANTAATTMRFDHSNQFRIGDEIIRSGTFASNTRSYITQVRDSIRLTANIANVILTGTVLELTNINDGSRSYATTMANSSAGTSEVFVNESRDIVRGYLISVKGIDQANAAVVDSIVGTTVTLSQPTTNLIPAGTSITMDDLSGNVAILTTASVTEANSVSIAFTSVGNVSAGYYPSITAIPLNTSVRSKFTDVQFSSPVYPGPVIAGSEIGFRGVITTDGAIGDATIYISNTSKISLGAEVFGVAVTSDTAGTASWSSATGTTLISLLVPTADINGEIFRGMRVIGPGLPDSSTIVDIEIFGANTSIHTGFSSAQNIVGASNAALSFFSLPVVNPGTTVIAKAATYIVLSSPLVAPLPIGGDRLIQFGLSDTQLNDVIHADNRWIIVGAKGIVLDKTASDRGTWSSRFALAYGDLFSVAYGNGYYVGVGSEGIIIRSTDIENWSTPISTLGNRSLRSVDYFNGTWVAVGDGGAILTSTNDGASWTVDTATTTQDLKQVAYLNRWVIVGQQGLVLARTDTESDWTEYNAGVSDTLTSIVYVNNNYYASGTRGAVVISNDISSWTTQARITDNNLNRMARSAPVPIAVGNSGTILSESNGFTVDWAIRSIPFDEFNWRPLNELAILGYNVSPGETLIFAQQEGFDSINDGWNFYPQPYDAEGHTLSGFYDTLQIIPGFFENQQDPLVSNQRAGIWRVNINTNNIVTLSFIRQINVNQIITVRNEATKLFLDPGVKPGNTVPAYSLLSQSTRSAIEDTSFDGEGTRFASAKDSYTDPGTLDKYLKFIKTGVFR